MPNAARRGAPAPRAATRARSTADRLHGLAIHLLRSLRREDAGAGLSAPRLSALSVVVFAGPLSLGELAAAEQVSAPTMSRLVRALEGEGLVWRQRDERDARAVRVTATPKGVRLLEAGRARRVASLADAVAAVDRADRELLDRAVAVLERVVASLRDRG